MNNCELQAAIVSSDPSISGSMSRLAESSSAITIFTGSGFTRDLTSREIELAKNCHIARLSTTTKALVAAPSGKEPNDRLLPPARSGFSILR